MSNIERIISVFSKKDENLVKEINIDHINLEVLQDIFKPKADDYELRYVYQIGIAEALHFKKIIEIEFDFDKYVYQLDCFSK